LNRSDKPKLIFYHAHHIDHYAQQNNFLASLTAASVTTVILNATVFKINGFCYIFQYYKLCSHKKPAITLVFYVSELPETLIVAASIEQSPE
jgi:hypothetical protein